MVISFKWPRISSIVCVWPTKLVWLNKNFTSDIVSQITNWHKKKSILWKSLLNLYVGHCNLTMFLCVCVCVCCCLFTSVGIVKLQGPSEWRLTLSTFRCSLLNCFCVLTCLCRCLFFLLFLFGLTFVCAGIF